MVLDAELTANYGVGISLVLPDTYAILEGTANFDIGGEQEGSFDEKGILWFMFNSRDASAIDQGMELLFPMFDPDLDIASVIEAISNEPVQTSQYGDVYATEADGIIYARMQNKLTGSTLFFAAVSTEETRNKFFSQYFN